MGDISRVRAEILTNDCFSNISLEVKESYKRSLLLEMFIHEKSVLAFLGPDFGNFGPNSKLVSFGPNFASVDSCAAIIFCIFQIKILFQANRLRCFRRLRRWTLIPMTSGYATARFRPVSRIVVATVTAWKRQSSMEAVDVQSHLV